MSRNTQGPKPALSARSRRGRTLALAVLLVFAPGAFAADALADLGELPLPAAATRVAQHKSFAPPAAAKAGQVAHLQSGSDWLITQQSTTAPTTGALPWTPAGGYFSNTQGASALGWLRAYGHTGDADHLAAALANGECQIAGNACIANFEFGDGDHRFASHDPLFLVELSLVSGDDSYQDFVDQFFWQKLTDGEYGSGNDLDAGDYADLVMASRTSQNIPELVAWDLSKTSIAAASAGKGPIAAAFLQRQLASLNAANASFDTYDVIGLAGALWSAATLGAQLDPTTGTWAAADNNADLAAALLARQAPGGGFVYSTSVPVVDAEADAQTTAFAMQALYALDAVLYRDEIAAGFAFIVSLQQPSGQFLAYAGADPNAQGAVESHGEALEAYAVGWIRPHRYVDATGGSDDSDCSTPSDPCLTIQYAVDQADVGNTIHVQSGTYVETVVIGKPGLHLLGEGPARPVIDRVSGSANQHMFRVANARNVRIENFEFRADKSFVGEAIVANGNVDGLHIAGNLIVQRWSNTAQTSTFRFTNAISINRSASDNSAGMARFDGSTVTIAGNNITGSALPNPTNFRACISMDSTIGRVRDNPLLACGTHDLHARFMYRVAGVSSGSELRIDNNVFGRRGVELSSPNTPLPGGIVLQQNTFNAPADADNAAAWPPAADFSLVRLIGNGNAVSTTLVQNAFDGHAGNFRGVLIENWPNVQLLSNTFTPKAGATDFVSLVLSNKEVTSDAPAAAPRTMTVNAQLNVFNGSGIANAGRAIELLNDNDAAGGAAFGALLFGGGAFANDFDANHRWYFRLDDHTCNTHVAAPPVPQCSFLGYTLSVAAPGSNTEVRPFRGDVSASGNRFGGLRPSEMSGAQVTDLVAHTQDERAHAALGLVDYGVGATVGDVYVDDGFAGAGYGDELAFTHGDTGAITVYFGIDAFATVPDGIAAVATGGRVFVAHGTYAAPATLGKDADLIGDGAADANPANRTVLTGGLAIAAGGSLADPLRVAKLRASNAAGDGITITGSQSNIVLQAVVSANNLGHGLQVSTNSGAVSTTTTNLRIEDSEFVDNGADKTDPNDFNGLVAGLLFDENASVDGLVIEDSKFSGNNAAGLSFNDIGAPASNAIIRNVTITGSEFSRNNRIDGGSAGGGIWLKTSGAGSRIENVDISGSTFADNGTGRTNTFPAPNLPRDINANGISVRVRAGTFLSGVRICGNTFAETTTPGTQETGIYVYDQTGHTGYQPIEVCSDNVFTDLAQSVSGYEQYGATLTQPVVNITGGALAGTEAINAPVLRVRDGALFTSFSQGIADAATVAGDVLRGGAGRYTENLAIGKNDLTIEGIRGQTLIEGRRGPAATPSTSTQPGIRLANGVTGSTIRDLTVQNFGSHCVLGAMSNNGTVVSRIDALNCTAPSPLASVQFNAAGGLDGLTFEDSLIDGGGFRGFVVWDGVKHDITVTGNTVRNIAGCCGIELQDGAASGVRIEGNDVSATGDNGLGLTGLTGGAGANLILDNVVSNGGRYGIEIKNPNGSGVDIPDAMLALPAALLPDGAIVVAGNTVTMNGPTAKVEDVAGIAVMRRAVTALNVDIPAGVIVRDNTVSGWSQPNANDGFGIVVEGNGSRVSDNVLTGNDVALQLQAGNAGYPGDAPQAATDDFFSRANSPATCSFVGDNTVDGAPQAGATRNVSNPASLHLQAGVQNLDTLERFCSIQAAIDDADTLAGHTLAVEAGVYAENVVVNKRLTLLGAFAGIAGDGQAGAGENGAARDGTGESVISPPAGRAMTINADFTVLDGFTFTGLDGAPNTVALSSGGNFGGNANDVAVRNNRFVALANTALYTNGPTRVARWTVSDNLFDGVAGNLNSAINLWKADDSTISDNTIRDIGFGGIQLNQNTDVQVLDNTLDHIGNNGINIGPQVVDATVRGNVVTDANHDGSDPDEAALTLYSGIDGLRVTCNVFDQGVTTRNAISTKDFAGAVGTGNAIFHNRVIGRIEHNNAASAFEVSSNWYDGGAAVTGGANAAQLRVADAMTTNPIGHALCGDNTAAQFVLHAGTPQTTEVNQPFAQVLQARVVDALGAAVPGTSVTFTAPNAGTSALLTPVSGAAQATDYNGVAAAAAIANGFAGSYVVQAASGLGTLAFALTNTVQDQVVLDLAGPAGGVEVGDEVAYTGFIGNTNANVNEDVFVRLVVGGSSALDPADVSMCVVNPLDTLQCAPFVWTDEGATLSFDFPGDLGGDTGFDITSPLPYAFTHVFRTVYGEAGVFSASAQVVGEISGTVYATDVIATEVIAQAAGIALDVDGPVAGVEKDAPTLYTARLTNSEAAVRDAVVVEFSLMRTGGIQAGDLTVEYDLGGGNFAVIPLMDVGGALVAQFGGAGFVLGAGYDATSTLRVTFHTAPDTFAVAATVIDAAANEDGVSAYAADQLATEVIESDEDIVLTLDGPYTTAAGSTAAAAQVDGSVFFRSTLQNLGGDVADQVLRSLQLSASYGTMAASDVAIEWWQPGGDSTCATQAAAPQSLTLASDGADGLEGDFGAAFALTEDFSDTLCFEVGFARAGVLSMATVVADAGADTDGSATYAADNLSTTVAKGSATLALSGTGSFAWDGNPHAATVTTTPAGLETVTITYDGSATPPTAAGTYTVFASLANDDYEAPAVSGTIVITQASIVVSDIAFAEGGTTVVYDGTSRAIVFTATPAEGSNGIACSTSINGGSALPLGAGSYSVSVQCDGPDHTGSGAATLTVARADSGIELAGGTFTYDGAPKAATVTNANGAGFTLSYAGTGATTYPATATPPVDAGTYLATLTVDDPDYEETAPLTAAIAIDPASVTMSFGNLAHVYDGTPKSASVSTTPAGVPGVSLSYAPDAAPANAGDYLVTASLASPNHVLSGGNTATMTIAKATAQVSLSDLTQLFDGTPKPVTVATSPAGLEASTTVTYDGSSTAPSAVGSYAVVATVNDGNYAGGASGTLTILAAAIADFEVEGGITFAGIAGAPLAGALPAVKVLDGSGNAVPSVTVAFEVTGGEGSGGGQVTTDAGGIATAPSWTLGVDAGTNTMTARVVGLTGLPTLSFTAQGTESSDLSVSIDSAQTQAEAGQQLTYTIVVGNAGPSNAALVEVLDLLPSDFASATWTCTAAGGALCGATADVAGSGDVDLDAQLPVGGSLTIVLVATLDSNAPIGLLDNVVTVAAVSGADPDTSDNSDSYTLEVLPQGGVVDLIFRDGFEDLP